MKQKLYRLSLNKDIMLNNVISMVRDKVEIIESNIRFLNKLNPDEIEIIKEKSELIIYQTSYDVLITILLHSKYFLLEDRRMKYKNENWMNEYDIPLEIYKSGIETAINLMEKYKGFTSNADYKLKYNKELNVLNELFVFKKD